jgi:subtilisin family serine protease
MGTAVLVPSFSVATAYLRVGGTSVAAPLVAGVAALLLEAHPGWGPFEVREALRQTALNSFAPNHDIGWGLVQGNHAVAWMPSTTDTGTGAHPGEIALAAAPSPALRGAAVSVRFALPAGETAVVEAFDARGRKIARLYEGPAEGGRTVAWNGRTEDGRPVPAGIYWLRLVARDGAPDRSTSIVLLP